MMRPVPGIYPGIPDRSSVESLTRGELHRELDAYSDAFLQRHRDALGGYVRRWVSDPFHLRCLFLLRLRLDPCTVPVIGSFLSVA
jgi:hypothetical protein